MGGRATGAWEGGKEGGREGGKEGAVRKECRRNGRKELCPSGDETRACERSPLGVAAVLSSLAAPPFLSALLSLFSFLFSLYLFLCSALLCAALRCAALLRLLFGPLLAFAPRGQHADLHATSKNKKETSTRIPHTRKCDEWGDSRVGRLRSRHTTDAHARPIEHPARTIRKTRLSLAAHDFLSAFSSRILRFYSSKK